MDLQESLRLRIEKKGLNMIGANTFSQTERIKEINSPEEIYNCLQTMEESSDKFDFIYIDNNLYRSHLVLLNNSEPIVCLGYNEKGEYDAFIPIHPIYSKGANHQIFAYRYFIFLKLSKLEELPDYAYEKKEFSNKPKDQQMLSKYTKAINGEIPMTEELKQWWWNRY
jgi:hypothetical protein